MSDKENTMKTVKTNVRDMIADLIADGSSIEEDEAHRGESKHGPAWEGPWW